MKRTQIKRKTCLKKQGKQKISVIQRKLWNLCREITRAKYPNVCYTCGQTGLGGSNMQTGHLWAKVSLGAFLKYDLRVLRIQCFLCNIHRGGAGADFYRNMLKEIGQEKMEELERDRKVSVKAMDWYLKLIPVYQQILESLKENK